MAVWKKDDLRTIAEADDLHIAPFHQDGTRYGTPTWIWPVAVNDALYVRRLQRAELALVSGCSTTECRADHRSRHRYGSHLRTDGWR
jgi:Uncharacterized protein conserved in bacteria (DUF2255)